jgi:hypothetical protein
MTNRVIESLGEWESVVHRLARPYGNSPEQLALPDIVRMFLEDYEIAPDLMHSLIAERTTEYTRQGLDKAVAKTRANVMANAVARKLEAVHVAAQLAHMRCFEEVIAAVRRCFPNAKPRDAYHTLIGVIEKLRDDHSAAARPSALAIPFAPLPEVSKQ